jgi:hypothetical protein
MSFRGKRTLFYDSGKMRSGNERSGNVRSGKRRSTLLSKSQHIPQNQKKVLRAPISGGIASHI